MTQGTTKRLPTIGTVIRAWRTYHGFSSTELAEEAGVRLGYLSEIEHDRTLRPYEDYLEKLADALHVPLGDILGRRMPPEKSDSKKLKRATGPTLSPKQPAVGQSTQKASAPSTLYQSTISTSDQEILMHRLAALKKKVEAAEKNLRDIREELLEIEAIAVDMFGVEESHAPTTSGV